MLDWIQKLLSGEAGTVAQVISIVTIVNVVLSASQAVLVAIKDKTETKWDNKAAEWIGKALGWISKLIDWVQGNKEHKKDASS